MTRRARDAADCVAGRRAGGAEFARAVGSGSPGRERGAWEWHQSGCSLRTAGERVLWLTGCDFCSSQVPGTSDRIMVRGTRVVVVPPRPTAETGRSWRWWPALPGSA